MKLNIVVPTGQYGTVLGYIRNIMSLRTRKRREAVMVGLNSYHGVRNVLFMKGDERNICEASEHSLSCSRAAQTQGIERNTDR
jgi:hypothetical protein